LSKPDYQPTVTLTLTRTELELLTTLAADQLFRREFIDPKMPGYKVNTAELRLAAELVARMRALKTQTPPQRRTTFGMAKLARAGGGTGAV
jgi:hypothetical protein